MTTEEQKDIKSDTDSIAFVDSERIQTTTNKNSKWLLLLGAIALLAGGTIVWRSLSSSPELTVEVTDNIEQARLTVKTVPANGEGIVEQRMIKQGIEGLAKREIIEWK